MDTQVLLKRHTDLLLTTARGLDDLSAPSLCAGWSRAHVLSHLARNADGITAACRSVVAGTDETMYASSQARDADIEAGATRDAATIVADLTTTAANLTPVLDELTAQLSPDDARTVERTPGGVTFAARDLPFMRLREVVYHHVDLDAGFGFDDVEPELRAVFLQDEVGRLEGDAQVSELWRFARGVVRS